jgi:hypothetical protein
VALLPTSISKGSLRAQERNELRCKRKWAGKPERTSVLNHWLVVSSLANSVAFENCEQSAKGETGRDPEMRSHGDGLGCARGAILGCAFQVALAAVGAICWELCSLLR